MMETVKFEKHNRIAYITLNRPDALNALNDQLKRGTGPNVDGFLQ
jgi:enoyl-CoA hydratase/carnithine racemase